MPKPLYMALYVTTKLEIKIGKKKIFGTYNESQNLNSKTIVLTSQKVKYKLSTSILEVVQHP